MASKKGNSHAPTTFRKHCNKSSLTKRSKQDRKKKKKKNKEEEEEEEAEMFGGEGLWESEQSEVVPRDLPAPAKGDNLHATGTLCSLK